MTRMSGAAMTTKLEAWLHWKKLEREPEDAELVAAVEDVLTERHDYRTKLETVTHNFREEQRYRIAERDAAQARVRELEAQVQRLVEAIEAYLHLPAGHNDAQLYWLQDALASVRPAEEGGK